MNEYKHGHFLNIITYLKSFLFLLIIPILRGFLFALGGNLKEWLNSAELDIFIVVVIVLLAVLQWFFFTYRSDDTAIFIKKGFFIRNEIMIPMNKIITVACVNSFWIRIFSVRVVRCDTVSGYHTRSDFSLIVSKKESDILLKDYKNKSNSCILSAYRPRTLYVVAISFIMSNSFGGMILVATLIYQLGEIMGEQFSTRVYGTFEKFASTLALGFPPITAAIAYFLLFGWLFSFSLNILRYKNLTVNRSPDYIELSGGVLTIRNYHIAFKDISFIDIRQTVLTKILNFYSVFIYAVGSKKNKYDIATVIPSVSGKNLKPTFSSVFPEHTIVPVTIRPNKGALFKFITDPIYFCLGIPILSILISYFYPDWSEVIFYLAFMSMLPAVWFLILRLIDYFTSGIAKENGVYTLRCSSGFYLHTILVDEKKLSNVCLRQSIIQRFDGRCDVLISTFSDEMKRHHIRNLDKKEVLTLFDCAFTEKPKKQHKKEPLTK